MGLDCYLPPNALTPPQQDSALCPDAPLAAPQTCDRLNPPAIEGWPEDAMDVGAQRDGRTAGMACKGGLAAHEGAAA